LVDTSSPLPSQLGLPHLTDPVPEFGYKMPHDRTIVDVGTPVTKDQDSPLATENGPMQVIPGMSPLPRYVKTGGRGTSMAVLTSNSAHQSGKSGYRDPRAAADSSKNST
jgi:hypothetical protein